MKFLERIMDTPAFVNGKYNTHFIEENQDYLLNKSTSSGENEDMAIITAFLNYTEKLDKMQPEPMKTDSFSLSPSICYEGIFPEFIAAGMARKAGFLVNITNDAWFGNSDGPRQHLFNVRPRAMENRCYLLRCANTGISAVVGPDGRIVSQLPLNTRGRLQAIIYPATGTTFYTRHPHLSIFLLALIAAFSTVIMRRSKPDTGFS